MGKPSHGDHLRSGVGDVDGLTLGKDGAFESEIAGLRTEMDQAKTDADDAKSSLMAVKDEIKKLKRAIGICRRFLELYPSHEKAEEAESALGQDHQSGDRHEAHEEQGVGQSQLRERVQGPEVEQVDGLQVRGQA